eukprot:TRINITY_DN14139_c0_g1_i1.p3 TRINITY_DN14139_c0_g1~~TRINITY_DN14139_c0_g1_i1.p3  ORF type:complete len:114 (+),score=9.83 TRINITY_DN14139_c0_g1_i1:60-401(+)
MGKAPPAPPAPPVTQADLPGDYGPMPPPGPPPVGMATRRTREGTDSDSSDDGITAVVKVGGSYAQTPPTLGPTQDGGGHMWQCPQPCGVVQWTRTPPPPAPAMRRVLTPNAQG